MWVCDRLMKLYFSLVLDHALKQQTRPYFYPVHVSDLIYNAAFKKNGKKGGKKASSSKHGKRGYLTI